jgi:hypothetical protein
MDDVVVDDEPGTPILPLSDAYLRTVRNFCGNFTELHMLAGLIGADNVDRLRGTMLCLLAEVERLRAGESAAEARGRAAERERCAGMVREMARKLGLLAEHAHIARKDRDAVSPTPDYLEGSADTYEKAEQLARDLAERIGKGEA